MSHFETDDLPRLLERLYAAALDPNEWSEFLNALPAACGGARGILQLGARHAPSDRFSPEAVWERLARLLP